MTSLEALDRPALSGVAAPAEPAKNSYVNAEVLASIRAMSGLLPFDLSKFVQLLEELDGSVQAGYVYGTHALLRAVLDHIPPIFGQPHFDAVASNYPWSRTDRKYMQRLAVFRAQADDALHRQIGKTRDVLSAHDMPPAVMLNRLLIGCTEAMTTLISRPRAVRNSVLNLRRHGDCPSSNDCVVWVQIPRRDPTSPLGRQALRRCGGRRTAGAASIRLRTRRLTAAYWPKQRRAPRRPRVLRRHR